MFKSSVDDSSVLVVFVRYLIVFPTWAGARARVRARAPPGRGGARAPRPLPPPHLPALAAPLLS